MSTKPIDVKELARRFKRGNRWATARMREMRHLSAGGDLFTTEEWLLEWLVAESVPQTNWPKQNMDPLEEAVCSRVIQMMGELAKAGYIRVRWFGKWRGEQESGGRGQESGIREPESGGEDLAAGVRCFGRNASLP